MSVEPKPSTLLSQSEIQDAVRRLAGEISRDFRDKNPVIIGVLKGSFVFMADLIRQLDFPVQLDFVRLSSYGKGYETSGKIEMVQGLCVDIRGRDVVIVEDIIDTGLTTSYLIEYLNQKKPRSLKLCVLMDKPSRRKVPVDIHYKGFSMPDKFLVGYGIDWNEKYRNLPEVCFIEAEG